jgi:hypothetical protein
VHSFASYDPVADEWTDYGSPGGIEIDGAGVIDPERDLYLFIDARGSGGLFAIPLDASDSDFVELSVAGDVEIQSANKLGFDRDSATGRFVGWDDGADLFLLDAPSGDWRTGTWRWTRVAPVDASVAPVRNPNGTYGRLRYVASVNALVLVSSTEGPVWAYRLSPGAGTGPSPQADGGAGDRDAGAADGSAQPDPIGGAPDAGAPAPSDAEPPSTQDAGADTAPPASGTSDGCGCRVLSPVEPSNAARSALLAIVLALVRVARRRARRRASSA